MAVNEQDLDHLIQGLQRVDPKLHEILSRIVNDVSSMKRDLEPLVKQSKISEFGVADIAIPINITVGFTKTTINLQWDAGDSSNRNYEVRQGTDWDTAAFITITPTTDIHIFPSAGTPLTFLIKSINAENQKSENTAVAIANVEVPGSPSLSIEVIDNFVFLRWQVPSATFDIKQYELRKGTEFLGFREGTFTQFFEQLAGEYTYSISAIDIAGNKGPESKLTVHVNAPPDYVLTALKMSDFDGEKFRVKVYLDPSLSEAA
jgi:hypothetical protein